MMRAEHGDEIRVDGFGVCEVVQRQLTYYGPKLRIQPEAGDRQYLLHAPGPSAELELTTPQGETVGRYPAALEGTKKYDMCLHCGEPIKTVEHQRRSAIGACGLETEEP